MPDDEDASAAWTDEVANVVGRRVGYYRKLRKMTAQQLSDALGDVGVLIKRPVISNLENGYRKTVTVAEVIALAHVLNTPPLMLIFPLGTEGEFPLLPGLPYSPDAAERWFTGTSSFPIPASGSDQDLWITETEQLALLREHRNLADEWSRMQDVLDGTDAAGQNPRLVKVAAERSGEIEIQLRQVRRRLRRDELSPVELPLGLAHIDEARA